MLSYCLKWITSRLTTEKGMESPCLPLSFVFSSSGLCLSVSSRRWTTFLRYETVTQEGKRQVVILMGASFCVYPELELGTPKCRGGHAKSNKGREKLTTKLYVHGILRSVREASSLETTMPSVSSTFLWHVFNCLLVKSWVICCLIVGL